MSYKKCPVIFLDILGTKEKSDFDTQHKIQMMFHEALEMEQGMDANHEHTVYKRFITTFSDCAYIVYDYKDGIDESKKDKDKLFLIALYNTEKLLSYFLKEGFLYRGACTYGEVYYDEEKNMVFGPAINNVYMLEQNKAIYPRVIIDPDMADYFINRNNEIYGTNMINGRIIKTDSDGVSFIHALNIYEIGINTSEFESLYSRIIELSDFEISKCKFNIDNSNEEKYVDIQYKIIKKYEWMVAYLSSVKISPFNLENFFQSN